MRAWNIKYSIDILLSVRDQIGPAYGSEDLSILLYSLVRREKPAVVVELGTGLGVTTAWIAAALRENGDGYIHTIDNGSHFVENGLQRSLSGLSGPLYPLARLSETGSYEQCMQWIFQEADLADVVKLEIGDIDFSAGAVQRIADGRSIDMLFSDFNHSPATILQLLAAFLPHMSTTSTIYVDSASTYMPSYWMLEHAVGMLNAGKIPRAILQGASEQDLASIQALVRSSTFELTHLLERSASHQNSTAQLRIRPADVFPPIATGVRL